MNTDKIIRELEKIYGSEKGGKIYMTIMPGILADFNKMLRRASTGQKVTEKYQIEDNKAAIVLNGSRKAKDDFDIDAEVVSNI